MRLLIEVKQGLTFSNRHKITFCYQLSPCSIVGLDAYTSPLTEVGRGHCPGYSIASLVLIITLCQIHPELEPSKTFEPADSLIQRNQIVDCVRMGFVGRFFMKSYCSLIWDCFVSWHFACSSMCFAWMA